MVANQIDLVYYYKDVLHPNTIWVDLKKLDFSPKSGVRMLPIIKSQQFMGKVSDKFIKATPFKFQGI